MKNKYFFQSVFNALNGIVHFFLTERNGKIQFIIAIIVVFTSFILKISKNDWIIILWTIAGVFAFEMMNTAVEKIGDRISLEYDEKIKFIKDIAAGAVLVICICATIIGSIIFFPYLQKLLA